MAKHYFVTVENGEIREVPVPDSGTSYEIIASSEEVKGLQMLFKDRETHTKKAVNYLNKPFDEWGVDRERNQFDDALMGIYREIYNLGTEETRKNIEEMGILKGMDR